MFTVERGSAGSRTPVVYQQYAILDVANNKGCVVIDRDDAELIGRNRWCLDKDGYAFRIRRINGVDLRVLMHRLIMLGDEVSSSLLDVDHINRDKLDNRRSNLRVVKRVVNVRNQMGWAESSSRYKGVSWNKGAGKWRVQITIDHKKKHIGYFTDELEAARAYDNAAIELGWPLSGLNFYEEQI